MSHIRGGRGSSSTQKRQFKPNLSSANKRHIKQEVSSPPRDGGSNVNRGGRGRGGRAGGGRRGGSRGRRGASSTVIETASVFSQGPAMKIEPMRAESSSSGLLVGGSAGRAARGRDVSRRAGGGDGNEDEREEDVKDVALIDDARADAEALEALLNDHDFIASSSCTERFIDPVQPKLSGWRESNLMTSTRRRRVIDDDEPEPLDDAPAQIVLDAQQNAFDAAESTQFLFVQLPPGFNRLVLGENDDNLDAAVDVGGDVGDTFQRPATSSVTETTVTPAHDDTKEQQPHRLAHCTEGLPTDQAIGKLQIMKSGKVRLRIGDQTFPVDSAVQLACKQEIVSLSTGAGELCVLGEVTKRLGVRVDAESLVDAYNQSRP